MGDDHRYLKYIFIIIRDMMLNINSYTNANGMAICQENICILIPDASFTQNVSSKIIQIAFFIYLFEILMQYNVETQRNKITINYIFKKT